MDGSSVDTKKRIIEVAKRVFAEKGFDGTSVRNITEEAGVNVSAIHYHFGSKEDVLLEILAGFAIGFKEMTKNLKTPKSGDEFRIRLEMHLQQMLDYSLGQMNCIAIFQKEHDRIMTDFLEKIAVHFMESRTQFVEWIEASMQAGVIRKRNAHIFSDMFFSNYKGEVFDCKAMAKMGLPSLLEPEYREQWLEESIDIFWCALKPEENQND